MAFFDQPVLYSVDLQGCTNASAFDPASIAATFTRALQNAGATVVESVSHNFPGAGLTCVLILAESHAILHTWPETGTVNIDIFSCSSKLSVRKAIAEIGQTLGAIDTWVREIPRADGHRPQSDGRA
jgi:S-adenosylmethionine decarboxylase